MKYQEGPLQKWETISEGVEKISLRSELGENRVLLRIAPGKAYPSHKHVVPDEVFLVEGIYTDPGVEDRKEFGPGSYLYYPAGTSHHATTPTGCSSLVWNTNTNHKISPLIMDGCSKSFPLSSCTAGLKFLIP